MRTISLLVLCWLSISPCGSAQQAPQGQQPGGEERWEQEPGDGQQQVPSDFVRFVEDGDGGHLDTAITTYEKDGVQVVLYGAVHIADARCYQELNDFFTTCDVLLYELVGPEDYRPTKDREAGGFNPIAFLQNGLKRSMEMAFQLDEIDYLADNFVHADMTPREFEESMAERGESLLSMMLDMMRSGMQMQREQADAQEEAGERPDADAFDLVKAFRSGEGRHLMRMTFASQLEQMEMLAAGGDGSTLLEGRNEKCLRVLRRELDKGHKRIGIYYGAAHLPHMEQRLVEGFGFRKVKHEWLLAWDCAKRPDPKFDRELNKQRRLAKKQLGELAEAGRDYRLSVSPRPETAPTPRELCDLQRDGAPAYAGPVTDPWGTDYRLEKRARGLRWQAMSAGQDGEWGTDDDLVVAEPRRGGLFR